MELGIIEAFVRQRMAQDKTGHDIQHLERVVANAQRLMTAESQPIKTSIVLAAVWLHDVIDDKVTSNPAQARREVAELLIQAGATLPERDAILEIINRQSFSKNLHILSLLNRLQFFPNNLIDICQFTKATSENILVHVMVFCIPEAAII